MPPQTEHDEREIHFGQNGESFGKSFAVPAITYFVSAYGPEYHHAIALRADDQSISNKAFRRLLELRGRVGPLRIMPSQLAKIARRSSGVSLTQAAASAARVLLSWCSLILSPPFSVTAHILYILTMRSIWLCIWRRWRRIGIWDGSNIFRMYSYRISC